MNIFRLTYHSLASKPKECLMEDVRTAYVSKFASITGLDSDKILGVRKTGVFISVSYMNTRTA